MEENKEEKKEPNKSQAIRVDNGKTYVIGGKVLKVAQKRDITSITGKDKVDPEDVALVVQANGEEEKEKDKEKSKFKAKYLVPILALFLIPVLIHSCASNVKEKPNIDTSEQTIEQTLEDIQSFNIELFNIPNPYIEAWKSVRSKRSRRADS